MKEIAGYGVKRMKHFALIFAVSLLFVSAAYAVNIQLTYDHDYIASSKCESCDDPKVVKTPMIPTSEGVCFLNSIEFEQLNTDEDTGICEIISENSRWVLSAKAKSDADAVCYAQCLKWSDQPYFQLHSTSIKEGRRGNIPYTNNPAPIQCSNGDCMKTNSFCGLSLVELEDVDSVADGDTWCNLYADSSGKWFIEAQAHDNAYASCAATCVEINEPIMAINFNTSRSNSTYAHSGGSDERIMAGATSQNMCTLNKVYIKRVSDDKDRGICSVSKNANNQWTLLSRTVKGDDGNAAATCEGFCYSWENKEIPICGNGAPESGEECDDGSNNGRTGNCSVTCKKNYCEGPDTRIGECADSLGYAGMLCKNFGTVDSPVAILVPNCAGQNDAQMKCNNVGGRPGCDLTETCALGAVDVNQFTGTPLESLYVPLFTSFEEDDTLPNTTNIYEVDGRWGLYQGNLYEIVNYKRDNTLYFTFRFATKANDEYIAEADVRPASANESIRLFGYSGFEQIYSPYAQKSGGRISYKFTAPSSSYVLNTEIAKRGSYFLDEIKVSKLDMVCQPKCNIASASFTKIDSGVVDKGTLITANVEFTGACEMPFWLQIDAESDDSSCRLERDDPNQQGWISGIGVLCEESDLVTLSNGRKKCSGTWVVPDIPDACAGKRIEATYAGLWNDDISRQIDQETLDETDGHFTFTSTPIPATCGNNAIDDGEDCDNSVTTPQSWSCASMNDTYYNGSVTCNNRCSYDFHACTTQRSLCNNPIGVIDEGEECDGTNRNGFSCNSMTYTLPDSSTRFYTSGTLSCYPRESSNYCKFDKSGCVKPVECGDGIIDSGEECDGTNMGSKTTCDDYDPSFSSTPLSCDNTCHYDINSCVPSGCKGGAPNGICEMAFETRTSCEADCRVELTNVAADGATSNIVFSAQPSSDSTAMLDTFIACKYSTGFLNRQSCVSAAETNSCGISASGVINDCICSSSFDNRCGEFCYDVNGSFYIYAKGWTGIDEFQVQSKRTVFSCKQIGLASLRTYKTRLDRLSQAAYSNSQYAHQNNLPYASLYDEIVSLVEGPKIRITYTINLIDSGSAISEADVASIISEVRAVFAQYNVILQQIHDQGG